MAIRKDCAIIPAYNEEDNIAEVVSKVKKMNLLPIVIDDNSKDRTADIAEKEGAVVVQNKRTRGKGEAIKTGIEFVLKNKPKVRNFVFIDADMQYHPEEVKKLLMLLKTGQADIVTGYRDWSKVPFRHQLGNFVWRTTFNLLFGTRLKDTNCGFVAMTKRSAEIVEEVLGGGYIIENAILARAVKERLRIRQVPVKVSYKHKSGVQRGIRMVAGIFFFIIREGVKYRLGK